MQNKIPHFKHRYRDGSSSHYEFIEIDNEIIHRIENLNEFYKAFGFTDEMAKAGMLPDEFIWDEYVKDNPVNSHNCMQIHFIEYLMDHSTQFMEKYGSHCKNWINAYTEKISINGRKCATCRLSHFCSKKVS